jgi:hypothetical protein
MKIIYDILMGFVFLGFLLFGVNSLLQVQSVEHQILAFMCLGFAALIFGQGAIISAAYTSKEKERKLNREWQEKRDEKEKLEAWSKEQNKGVLK